jgi:hypothetical protein
VSIARCTDYNSIGAANDALCRTGAVNLESEEREAATGRSQNVVHILPQSTDSVPRFLTGPLERVDPASGGTQLVVITEDAESAIALAEAVLRLTGLGGIELFPVTTARRAARLIQGRPVLAVAGAPSDIADLIRGSQLKLQDVRCVVLAWADDVLDGDADAIAALELVMTELPKDADRVLVTSRADARVDAFVERYLRRARRMDEQSLPDDAEPVSLQYLTATAGSRPAALRRLLDDIDPPSAAVIVGSGSAASDVSAMLKTLGYPGEGTVQVVHGDAIPQTHAVIFYGIPANRHHLAAAVKAGAVRIIALVQPREVQQLRRMAGGEVKPLTLDKAGKSARDREHILRRELSGVLESGVPAREILALEPLLDRFDGIEIAAAALRLLERERATRKSAEDALKSRAVPDALTRGGPERGHEDRSERAPRRDFADRNARPPRRGAEDQSARPPRPPRPERDDRGRPGAPASRGQRPFRGSGGPDARRGGRPPTPGGGDRRPGPRPGGGRPPRDRS